MPAPPSSKYFYLELRPIADSGEIPPLNLEDDT